MADWGAPRRALAIMFGALILFMGSSFAAGPAGASPGAVGDDGERITVREDTHDSGGSCRPRFMALGRTVVDTDESFTIRINVRQPLCTPLEVTAAVYAMPGRGVAWPQQLVETERFTLQRAGTVEVVFSKGCQPVQFDIVTGATPDSIAPWSAWHGPLLFPMDTSSSLQHWGNGCGASTTTVPSTPSSEPPAPTSTAPVTVPPQNEPSTVPPEVLGSTTLQTDGGPGPEDPGTAATVRQPPVTEPDVLGSSSSVPGLPAGLALTGIAARALVLAAGVLLVLGVAMVVVGRVRARSDGF